MHDNLVSNGGEQMRDDRDGISDALFRFAAGQDYKEPETLRSAFAADAVLDFTHPGAKLGVQLERFVGRDEIMGAILGATARLDTSHTVTNIRLLEHRGSDAVVCALIEAQHLPSGDHSRNLLLKNKIVVRLALSEAGWVIADMRFENLWWTGDPDVLFPPSAGAVEG